MNRLDVLWIFCLAMTTPLLAAWSPDYLNRPVKTAALQASDYIALQNKMIQYLENSWCSKEKVTLLMDLVILEKPQVCVEIGAFTGSSVLPVAAALKYNGEGEIYAVDAWSNQEATRGMANNDPNKQWWTDLNMQGVLNAYHYNIAQWNANTTCKTLQVPSNIAVNSLPAIDLLHMDGNYSREGSCEDVLLYLPKVKIGGYILFTNINWYVNEQATRMNAFSALLDSCEIIAFIDERSTYLLRKIGN